MLFALQGPCPWTPLGAYAPSRPQLSLCIEILLLPTVELCIVVELREIVSSFTNMFVIRPTRVVIIPTHILILPTLETIFL